MLKHSGPTPGTDLECDVILGVAGPEDARRVATALRQSGQERVDIDRDRKRFTRRSRWWVVVTIVLPEIGLEAMDIVALGFLAQAERLNCRLIGVQPQWPSGGV